MSAYWGPFTPFLEERHPDHPASAKHVSPGRRELRTCSKAWWLGKVGSVSLLVFASTRMRRHQVAGLHPGSSSLTRALMKLALHHRLRCSGVQSRRPLLLYPASKYRVLEKSAVSVPTHKFPFSLCVEFDMTQIPSAIRLTSTLRDLRRRNINSPSPHNPLPHTVQISTPRHDPKKYHRR